MNAIKRLIHKARHSFFLVGLASILWFIFRTGSKPTRMSYPCQQASAASGSLWITAYLLPFILTVSSPGKLGGKRRMAFAGFLLLLFVSFSVLFGDTIMINLTQIGSGGMGTEMAETRFPDLNILDAIWINANPRGGPSTSYGEADQVVIIAARSDPVALDYWGAKNILMPAARQKGYDDLESMDPDNTSPGSFGNWLRLSSAEIAQAGHQAAVSEENMSVYLAR